MPLPTAFQYSTILAVKGDKGDPGAPGAGSTPTFWSTLASTPAPVGGRGTVHLDGHAAIGDGGHGDHHWDDSYAGPSDPLHVYPFGHSPSVPGAWVREIGSDNTITAAMFGAVGDAHLVGGNVSAGTDDTAALQAMLDYNCDTGPNAQPSAFKSQYKCKLNAGPHKYTSGLSPERTCYRITQPIQKNDVYLASGKNTTTHLVGEPGPASGLFHRDYLGPAIVDGNYGINRPFVVQDPNGSGEYCWVFGQDLTIGSIIDTTIAAGSDGATLPQGTINVVTTDGWPHAGGFYLQSATITYTGKTSTSFTGCQVAWELLPGGATETMHTGDSVSLYQTPRWSFSKYSIGDLSGWTNFTLEFFVNPGDLNAYVVAKHSGGGGNYINCLFACGGSLDSDTFHDTMRLLHSNSSASAGVTYLQFQLSTVNGGPYTVTTSLSADHTWTANTLNHIAISYDGANLRMFINGTQADSSMTVACTGALNQQQYETIGWAQGLRPPWPYTGGAALFDTDGTVLLGRWRFSHNALYTSTFTPPAPSAVVPQSDTRLYAEPLSSVPARESLRGYTIARTVDNVYSAPMNVWLESFLPGPGYVEGSRIEDIFFSGRGHAIKTNASINAEFGAGCTAEGLESGILIDGFSYNSGVGKGFTVGASNGSGVHNHLATDMSFLAGSQFSYVKEGYISSGLGNWGIVCTFSDIEIKSNFPNSYKQGVYAFVQAISTAYISGGSVVDDSSSGYGVCSIMFSPIATGESRLGIKGGYIGVNNGAAPVIRIGAKDCVVDIDTPLFIASSSAALFSFQGNNAAQSKIPAVFHGLAASAAPIIDPAHPGPVLIPEQEMSGPFTVTPAADSDVTIDPGQSGDAFWREYILAAGAWTGGHNVVWPANPHKVYSGKNVSGFTATLKRVGSSSPVSVTNGLRFLVQDNGTDLVSLL